MDHLRFHDSSNVRQCEENKTKEIRIFHLTTKVQEIENWNEFILPTCIISQFSKRQTTPIKFKEWKESGDISKQQLTTIIKK